MIPLYLLDKKILNKPCFYISDYFEKNRTEYYDALTRVRENNDMTGWIKFFLKAVIVTSQMAKKKFQKVVIQVKEYESIAPTLKGKWGNILKILNIFYSEPILKSNEIVSKTGLSKTTVNSILKNMEEKEILSELTNYKRNKMYILRRYFMIFIEGIDLDEI